MDSLIRRLDEFFGIPPAEDSLGLEHNPTDSQMDTEVEIQWNRLREHHQND